MTFAVDWALKSNGGESGWGIRVGAAGDSAPHVGGSGKDDDGGSGRNDDDGDGRRDGDNGYDLRG